MKKFGLIGEKLGHSYSKIIHERFFELTDRRNFVYDLIEIPKDELEVRLDEISRTYDGINVTIPYKFDVMKHLTCISDEAKKIGAVNTIVFTKDGNFGYNTDYFGLRSSFENNGISIKGKRVVILGTGGASKAALTVCENMGASSVTFVTTGTKAVEGYNTIGYNDEITGDVLVNCTPVGMYPNGGKSPLNTLDTGFEAIMDMIYNPSVTELMRQGREQGMIVVNGLNMLVSQAMYSQAIWNDEEVNTEAIRVILEELRKKFD